MFFDATPPDTSAYMIAGYVIFFVITLIYLASLYVRTRNLNQDINTLSSVQEERHTSAARSVTATPKLARSEAGKAKPATRKPATKKATKKR